MTDKRLTWPSTTGDARTVLVPCEGRCAGIVPAVDPRVPGGIMLGTPIPSEPPDPSKIIGTIRSGPPEPEPELPPTPPAGFYWAKCGDDAPDEWAVVRVFEEPEGGRWVDGRWVEDTSGGATVHEWGPALPPPGSVPTLPADAHPLLHDLARVAEYLDRDIARLMTKRAAALAELRSRIAEWRERPDALPPTHAETCCYVGCGRWECVAGCTMTPDDILREEAAKRSTRPEPSGARTKP